MIQVLEFINKLENNTIFTEDFVLEQLNIPPNKLSTVRWDLYHLRKNNVINKVGKKTYQKSSKNLFNYELVSKLAFSVKSIMENKYKNIKWCIFDSRILNNWINLLTFEDVVFVEVESVYTDFVSESLSKITGSMVLLNPTIDEFYKYKKEKTIIVKKMVSKSPITDKHLFSLEKLFVDFQFDKFYSKYINESEIDYLIETLFKKYVLNIDKTISYSKRRKKDSEVKQILLKLEKQHDKYRYI